VSFSRLTFVLAMLAAVCLIAAGCGDNNSDSTKTGAGTPAGTGGNADGGHAVEEGKQRDQKDVQQEKETFSEEPPPVQLQSGDRSDFKVSKPTIVISKSQKELNSVIRKLGVKKSDVAPVDFKGRQAVLVQMPTEPRGTLMQIQDVSVRNGVITVRVARLKPGEGCKTVKYKPNPFNLVETRAMSETKRAVTVEDVNSSPC
jgi:hypothetical protein